tara:strand:- start:459 stop:584 length:126 start_codon:yes stop_codon:yes gene_type:complete
VARHKKEYGGGFKMIKIIPYCNKCGYMLWEDRENDCECEKE